MLKITIITIFLHIIASRVFQTSMKFSYIGKNNGWVYLDKMSFAPGVVQYKIRTQVKGIPYGAGGQVILQAIPQYMWQHQQTTKCRDVQRQPYIKHKLSVSETAIDFSRQTFNLQQTTLYYFVLKDCQRVLKAQYENNNMQLNVQLFLLNNGREVGEEEDHWYIIAVILGTAVWMIWFYNGKLKGQNIKEQWHRMMAFAGIATQVSSLVWKTLGFVLYVNTGSDYVFFHLIYLFMHSVSQSLVIGLIVMIGFGWTINFKNLKDAQIYLPLLVGMAFINALLTLLTKLQSDEHDRHHIFDNISGHVMIGYRVLILIVFVIAITTTYLKTSVAKTQKFIIAFGIFGSLYIAAMPIIILMGNNFVQAKDRHEFVFVAMQALKCATNVAICLMLNRQKSMYNQVSHEQRSFLPQNSKRF